jgi:hypothetical protein
MGAKTTNRRAYTLCAPIATCLLLVFQPSVWADSCAQKHNESWETFPLGSWRTYTEIGKSKQKCTLVKKLPKGDTIECTMWEGVAGKSNIRVVRDFRPHRHDCVQVETLLPPSTGPSQEIYFQSKQVPCTVTRHAVVFQGPDCHSPPSICANVDDGKGERSEQEIVERWSCTVEGTQKIVRTEFGTLSRYSNGHETKSIARKCELIDERFQIEIRGRTLNCPLFRDTRYGEFGLTAHCEQIPGRRVFVPEEILKLPRGTPVPSEQVGIDFFVPE